MQTNKKVNKSIFWIAEGTPTAAKKHRYLSGRNLLKDRYREDLASFRHVSTSLRIYTEGKIPIEVESPMHTPR